MRLPRTCDALGVCQARVPGCAACDWWGREPDAVQDERDCMAREDDLVETVAAGVLVGAIALALIVVLVSINLARLA